MTLVEWLTAILDEDERVARAVGGGHWEQDQNWVQTPEPHPLLATTPELAEHIALHDPATVLADIAAKRRMLNLCAEWEAMALASPETWAVLLVCAKNTRRLLASAYAHRDGFDPSWA